MEIPSSHTTHTGETPATHFHTDDSDTIPSGVWPQAIAGKFGIFLDLFERSNTTGQAENFPLTIMNHTYTDGE